MLKQTIRNKKNEVVIKIDDEGNILIGVILVGVKDSLVKHNEDDSMYYIWYKVILDELIEVSNKKK
jgi:hypothetical protein